MPNCIFCGQSAGFLRRKHASCQCDVLSRQLDIERIATQYVRNRQEPDNIVPALQAHAGTLQAFTNIPKAISQAVEISIEGTLDGNFYLPLDDERILSNYLQQVERPDPKVGDFIAQSAYLRRIIEGEIITAEPPVFLDLAESERVVLTRRAIDYAIPRWKGPSLLRRGIRYIPSSYKKTTGAHIVDDRGDLVITTNGLHFRGRRRSFSIPHRRLFSVDGYADGIVVTATTERCRMLPQVFLTGSGWVYHSLLTALKENNATPAIAIPKTRMARNEMKQVLISRWGLVCWGCGFEPPNSKHLELDHNNPVSLGGRDELDNRAPLCGPCNKAKSNTLTLEGLRQLNKKSGNWHGDPPINERINLRTATEWARSYLENQSHI